MSSAEAAEPPHNAEAILSSLAPLPTTTASLLALSSRVSALEQALSFEAASSPPISVHLPPLPASSASAAPAAATSAASSPSTSAATTSRKSREVASSSSSPSSEAPPSLSFLAKLQELSGSVAAVEDEAVVRFLSLHAQVEALLHSASPLSSFLSSSALKQQLLLSHYDDVLAAQRELQEVASLVPSSLSPPPLSLTSAQLTAAESAQRLRLVEAAQLHVAVDRFLSAYDDAVHQLNSALIAADRRLKSMERSLDRLQPSM